MMKKCLFKVCFQTKFIKKVTNQNYQTEAEEREGARKKLFGSLQHQRDFLVKMSKSLWSHFRLKN